MVSFFDRPNFDNVLKMIIVPLIKDIELGKVAK